MNIDQTWNGQIESDWRHSSTFSKTERDIYKMHFGFWQVLMAVGSPYRERCLKLVEAKNQRIGLQASLRRKVATSRDPYTLWNRQFVLHILDPNEVPADVKGPAGQT